MGCTDSWPLFMIKRLFSVINIYTVHSIMACINNIEMCHRKPQISQLILQQMCKLLKCHVRKGSWKSGLLFTKLFQPFLESGKRYEFSSKNQPLGNCAVPVFPSSPLNNLVAMSLFPRATSLGSG